MTEKKKLCRWEKGKPWKWGQMSESRLVVAVLCISGGYQDAYTYNCREHVFANAQTGNMVLMGQNIALGNWRLGIRYLLPVLAFAAGIYFAERLRHYFKEYERIHWRQIVLILEMLVLFLSGFLPGELNLAANTCISFVCAMQVQSFRKMNGNPYATTMCIGNMRTATELLCRYHITKEKAQLRRSLLYYAFIGIFISGAAAGGIASRIFSNKAIWGSCLLLLAAFLLMFINAETKKGTKG